MDIRDLLTQLVEKFGGLFWKYPQTLVNDNLTDRMTHIVKDQNKNDIHYFKPFVVSLKCKNLLNYIKPITSVEEKLSFYKQYNQKLVQISEKLYSYFDPACVFVFNNEIHLMYFYNEKGDYMFNGNINKTLSVISSYVTVEYTKMFLNNNTEKLFENFYFEGTVVQFDKDHETLNYLIWRQLDCYRNTLNLLYKCHVKSDARLYKNSETDSTKLRYASEFDGIKLNYIIDELSKYNIPNELKYGVLLKKEVFYKQNEYDKNEMIKRKHFQTISEDFTLDFNRNLNLYIYNKNL